MLGGMTSGGEIAAWVILILGLIGGVIAVIGNWERIRDFFRERRVQRARTLGYRHRAARLELHDLDFKTSAERKAYRDGWQERALIEEEMEADELGMITAAPRRPKRGRKA